MGQKELLKTLTGLLNRAEVKYMVTGAWSVIYYGRVRSSHDLDFVIEVGISEADKLVKIFRENVDDWAFQEEAIREAVKKKGVFVVTYLPGVIKIDFWLRKESEFNQSEFARRVKVRAWGQQMYLTSPEDTVVQKLVWFKKSKIEKHLIDAAFVWQIWKKLDKKYIIKWANKLEVEKYLGTLDKVNIEDHW